MTERTISTIKNISNDKTYGYIEYSNNDKKEADYSFKPSDLIDIDMSTLQLGQEVSFFSKEWEDAKGDTKRSASDIRAHTHENVAEVSKFKAEYDDELKYLLPNGGVNDSELIIGLVSAVGTETKLITDKLELRLTGFDYVVETIRVSELLECDEKFSGKDEDKRIKKYMELGDKYREDCDNNSILAAGVIKKINNKRAERKKAQLLNSHIKKEKCAYIINSLKHPDEVELLRKVYGEGFYLIGIHAEKERRLRYLIKDRQCDEKIAEELIKIDENESVKHGQKTRDTFHLADLFLNLGKNTYQVENTLQRFLELIFSHPHKNPTFDEYAMFMAFNSSVRSGDLSRQVGAVLSKNKQILATGANDVPRAGGGLYWAYENSSGEIVDDENGKDYKMKGDPNKRIQSEIVDDIIRSISDKKNDNESGGDPKESMFNFSNDQRKALETILKKSRIGDLTEFGRVVHAEMEAILSCSREGISSKEATLYCTTFPCHNCAKHIIASGIKRVVYVEPYPKSMALELHGDSIELKELDSNEYAIGDKNSEKLNKVVFESFTGVGPRRFLDLFSMTLGMGSKLKRKNKDNGEVLSWSQGSSAIRTPLLSKSYLEIEEDAINLWNSPNNPNK